MPFVYLDGELRSIKRNYIWNCLRIAPLISVEIDVPQVIGKIVHDQAIKMWPFFKNDPHWFLVPTCQTRGDKLGFVTNQNVGDVQLADPVVITLYISSILKQTAELRF